MNCINTNRNAAAAAAAPLHFDNGATLPATIAKTLQLAGSLGISGAGCIAVLQDEVRRMLKPRNGAIMLYADMRGFPYAPEELEGLPGMTMCLHEYENLTLYQSMLADGGGEQRLIAKAVEVMGRTIDLLLHIDNRLCEMAALYDPDQELKAVAVEYVRTLTLLPVGETLLVPFSILSEDEYPHLVCFQFVKVDEDNVSPTLFNTGAGLGMHHKFCGTSYLNPDRTHALLFDARPLASLDQAFFVRMLLWAAYVDGNGDGGRRPAVSARSFYNFLKREWGVPHPGRHHKTQGQVDICYAKVLSVALHSLIAPGATAQDRHPERELAYQRYRAFVLQRVKRTMVLGRADGDLALQSRLCGSDDDRRQAVDIVAYINNLSKQRSGLRRCLWPFARPLAQIMQWHLDKKICKLELKQAVVLSSGLAVGTLTVQPRWWLLWHAAGRGHGLITVM